LNYLLPIKFPSNSIAHISTSESGSLLLNTSWFAIVMWFNLFFFKKKIYVVQHVLSKKENAVKVAKCPNQCMPALVLFSTHPFSGMVLHSG